MTMALRKTSALCSGWRIDRRRISAGSSVLAQPGWIMAGLMPMWSSGTMPSSVAADQTGSKLGRARRDAPGRLGRDQEGPAPPLPHPLQLADRPVDVVEAQAGDREQTIPVLSHRIGHPGVHGLEGVSAEAGIRDRPGEGVAPTGDQVLLLDALGVEPRHPRRRVDKRSVLVRSREGQPLRLLGEQELDRRVHQPVDRHALIPRGVPQEVVAHEPGEHLRRPHRKPGVGVRELLGQAGGQVRKLVEPPGRGLDMGVDVDDP